MYATKQDARDLIGLVLGNTLSLTRFKGSKISATADQKARKNGAVFVTRTKDDLRQARGLVMTSQEAIQDSVGASHWTPNVFRYGTYSSKGRGLRTFCGHEETNLSAINTFVVDVDYSEGQKPEYWDFDISCFTVALGGKGLLEPTMILDTPHGFQAYYVLDQPVWLRRTDDGRFPALDAAKRISRAIRSAVALWNDHTDTGANDFGFFRMPSANNLLEIDEDQRCNFKALMDWSITMTGRNGNSQSTKPQDQVHTDWFRALAAADVPYEHNGDYGRNNTLLTLCLAMFASGRTQEEAANFADEWNTHLSTPLANREVQTIVKSAYSGRYQGAAKQFIQPLCDLYAPGVTVQSGGHAWVHFAKAREDRQYSHQPEWAQDLLRYLSGATNLVDGYARFSVAELTEALGISRASLNKLLTHLASLATISVRRVRGRNGGLYLATAQMLSRHLMQLKGAAREAAAAVVAKMVRTKVPALGYEQAAELAEMALFMVLAASPPLQI